MNSNDSCGYIDKEGNEVIKAEYKNTTIFYYERALVNTFERSWIYMMKMERKNG